MEIEEFMKDLPEDTECDRCRRKISDLEWAVKAFGTGEWLGLCVVKCAKCDWVKIAAAGSSHEAHHRAQMVRAELIATMGMQGKNN